MALPPASLLVVSGPPGAGKSTVARILAERLVIRAVLNDPDQMAVAHTR